MVAETRAITKGITQNFDVKLMDGRKDGRTNERTDGRTDGIKGLYHPWHISYAGGIIKLPFKIRLNLFLKNQIGRLFIKETQK